VTASVSFDRASDYYDRTRALGEHAERAVVSLLGAEIGSRRCLEIGVGTGRIALPLEAAGIDIAGVDLSRPMLDRLVAKAGGVAPFPVCVGDAEALPFAAGRFGAALACHVLHLIPGWRAVIAEVMRVVEPGGVFLVDLGGWGEGNREVIERFSAAAGIPPGFAGVRGPDELDAAMRAAGASVSALPVVTDERVTTLARVIGDLGAGLFSFTWDTDSSVLQRAAEQTRAWARVRWGSLDEPRSFFATIAWRSYRLAVGER
jgi:SAM-dependent methyltransferase